MPTPNADSPMDNPVPTSKMTAGYDPRQLMRTGAQVIISTIFARYADDRRLQALVPEKEAYVDYNNADYRDTDRQFWFDFLADTGDGWNSGYAVATAVAADDLDIGSNDPKRLPRGRLLILGGDLVYPTPSAKRYAEQLVRPFKDAFPLSATESMPAPEVLAIPGNHDWYDGLVAFRRIFCTKQLFASWQTRQSRSYFAARLSESWWLLGVDVQLDHDIDDVQYSYFSHLAAKEIRRTDQVILCCAEPFWIHEAVDRMSAFIHLSPLLRELITQHLEGKVKLVLAGDLHHYRRQIGANDIQFVTCGTGGAFLHPTHRFCCVERGSMPR